MGSNRLWGWSLLEIWIFLLAGWWLLLYAKGSVSFPRVSQKSWPIIFCFAVWLVYLLFLLVPLPREVVASFSCIASELHALNDPTGSDGLVPLSVDAFFGWDFFLRSLSLVLLFFLALVLLKRRWRIRLFVNVIIWMAVFQAAFGSLMVLSGVEYSFFFEKEINHGLATGTFVNRNHLAGFLEMALALGIGLLMADLGEGQVLNWKQRLRNTVALLLSRKVQLRVFLAIMVIGLVLTRSRMGNTAFFSSMLVAGGIWLLLSHRRPKRSMILLLSSLLVIDILIVGNWFGIEEVVERLENTSTQSEIRDEVVNYGLGYSRDYLWLGSGGGSFYSTFPRYRQGGMKVYHRYAHNDYLQFLTETGVIGLG